MNASQVRRIVERHLENVRPSGQDNLRAECPFHESSSHQRSLYVHVREGSWLCFSCRRGGSIIRLLYLLGVPRGKIDQETKGLDLAPAVKPEVLRKLEVGKGWSTLPEYVLGAYDECPLPMLDLGFEETLLFEQHVGYDKRQDRITFAIRDYRGRLVGISGRACTDFSPVRYKVYDSEFSEVVENYRPNNRAHLYGFDDFYAERFMDRDSELPVGVLVEGYKGRLWMAQQGWRHTAALQGSSLTKQQERVLNKVRGPWYVFLDNEPGKAFPDEEGRCAAITIARSIARFSPVRICQYPEGTKERTSPDDLNKAQIEQILGTAKTVGQVHLRPPETPWRREKR